MNTHQPNMEAILSVEYLVSHFVSSSEEKKSEGESMFDKMKEQDPNSLALHLAHLVGPSDSHDIYFCEECADLLEKLLTDDGCHIWNNNLSVPTQTAIKSILLIHLNHDECSRYILVTLCYIISELCKISHNWPELFDFLHECITSDSNRLKQSFFYIFSKLTPDICKQLFPDIMTLHSLFQKTMNDDTLNFYTRASALYAAINFIQCLSSLDELKRSESLFPSMMKTLDDALSQGDRNLAAQYMLRFYIKLARNEPRFFKLDIVDVVNTMFEIAENMNLEENTKHLALEFLIRLVEAAREKAPGMMKKLPRFTHTYFSLLLSLLLDVKDESSWYIAENCLDWSWTSRSLHLGLVYLRESSKAFGGKTVAHMAIEQLEDYLAAPEWEKRHAALIALVQISLGCSKGMIKYLERIVSMVLPSFKDPHPRVRWAAINSIVQLSIDDAPDLQQQYHIQIMPALDAVLDDFEHPRLQAITLVAVCNYFNNCEEPDALLPYVDTILNKLNVLLQNDNQMVQQEAIDALTSVVGLSMEHFQKYYGFVMPHLKTILVNAKDKSNHMLHSQALGCISMIGMAVGKEKFRDEVEQVMEVLITSQELPTKEFGTIYHILKAWLRIGYCIGKDFLPYMSKIMPILVKCARLQWDNKTNESYNSIHKVKFGDEVIYANISELVKVKSFACTVLGDFGEMLEEDFCSWIPEATSILIPLLKFYIYIDVRKSACTALGEILKSTKLKVEKETAQGENQSCFKLLLCNINHALGEVLYTEPNAKVCAHILHVLNICLKVCGPLLSEDLLPSIVDVMKHVIKESSYRREELTNREKSEDFDAEEAELLSDETETEENINEYGKDKTSAESIASICIFIELVTHCTEATLRYYYIYIPFLLEASNKEHPYLRQCALFGLVLCAEYGISIFKPFVGEALSRINQVIMHLHAREPKNERAFDNAVSALVKICLFHRECIGSGQIIPTWLNCLPIKDDIAEAKDVHDQLCMMVERSDTELLGFNYEHFPKVLSIFTEVLCAGKDLATEETKKRMINVLKNLQKIIPPATWAFAWSLLLPQHEMELEYALSVEEVANFSTEQ